MKIKHNIPLIGRLYRQRDAARAELDAVRAELEAAGRAMQAPVPIDGKLLQRFAESIPNGVPFPDWGREAFLKSLAKNCRIFDIGCGNNSPYNTKMILPECYYIGLDVGDYYQESKNLADEYILSASTEFVDMIARFENQVDAVISAHNLEHCENRENTIRAMARALKKGGRLYMSFPCADSVNFPARGGCLNYYDDASHRYSPPDFTETIAIAHEEGLRVLYASTRFQPPLGWVLGLQNEEASVKANYVQGGTWALWGFETVIWAERR